MRPLRALQGPEGPFKVLAKRERERENRKGKEKEKREKRKEREKGLIRLLRAS